jgi:PAS domain S-box-containing protein
VGIASIFDSCRSVVAIVRQADARFVDVNAAMQEQLGWAAADVVGLRPADINLWPDADTRSRIYAALRTRQRVVALPLLARHRNGELIPSLLDVECFTLDGEVMNFCLLRVGTQKHGISSDPEAEQASYRELFLAASEGLYRQLPDGGFIDVNPAMAEILGFASAAQMLASPAHLAAGIYADPEQAAQLKHELIRQGRIRNLRSRIRRRDGQERWILENAIAVRDEDGTLRFFEGSVVDITEQVAAESALRHSENMYRVLVDNCRDGVFLIQHGKMNFANPALADMLGYDQSELIGSDYMSLVASEDRPAQAQRREAREGGSMAPQKL